MVNDPDDEARFTATGKADTNAMAFIGIRYLEKVRDSVVVWRIIGVRCLEGDKDGNK